MMPSADVWRDLAEIAVPRMVTYGSHRLFHVGAGWAHWLRSR